ncbi:TonB-dependent siderophore receptor [Chitinophaga sp. HK235]|uniref:TonB-dependent receptor plug domain-containing protein n=1 Tax=Chitinophaga sp. HK235 TaxID=2952571 RepID=UPI001BA4ECD8|nr:TonB-dependent receptor [Chitinophaga sp. HK235]
MMRIYQQGGALVKIFLCLLPGMPAVLQAQQTDSTRTRELREVSVSAPRGNKEVAPGQQLKGKELQRLGTQSVADALRYFSGIQVKDYGGIGGLKTVDVRSMGTNHTGVFFDGIELGNAQNGQVDLGKFSLDNMEEISLYNGQKSSIFQPAKDYGSAGSIYLTSIKPRFEAGEQRHIKGTFKTGSFGLINPSILWQEKISQRVSASFNAEWINANGRYKFRYQKEKGYDTTAIRKNSDINALRVEGGLHGILNGGEWNSRIYFYNSERGLPGFVVNNVFGHVDRQWDRNFFVQSSWRKDLSKRYSLMLNGKYAYDYTHYLAPDTVRYIENRYRQQEVYVSVANQYLLTSWWNLGLSGDFQWNKLNADLTNFSYPQRFTTLVALATSVNFNRFSAQASLLNTIMNEEVKKNAAAPSHQELTPAVFVSWQPFAKPNITWRSFYKRIFRMPTFNDLYYTDIGNSNLEPEFATQYNTGLTWNHTFSGKILQELGVETDAYYNEVTNKIVAVPAASQFRWTMMNLGFVKIKGIDVKAKAVWQVLKDCQLSTRVNYTFQDARDFTSRTENFYSHQIPYIPWHSGSLVLGGSYRDWDLNYSFLYTGERYDSKENIRDNYMQPWYTSDITLTRSWKLNKTGFRCTAQVNNLFNQYYDVVLNYPMPGRNFKFILSVNI